MRRALTRALGTASIALPLILGIVATAAAQTTTATTTPGAPNTGAGGDAMTNILILGISAVVAVAGASYLAFRQAH